MALGDVLIAMTAIILGCSIVLIPVIGLTVRYAFRPMLELWSRTRVTSYGDPHGPMLDRRVALLEEQVHLLQRETQILTEDADFARQLADRGGDVGRSGGKVR